MSSRFAFNNDLLSEFSDEEVHLMRLKLGSAIDVLYDLSTVSSELGDRHFSEFLEELAFKLTFIIPQ